MIIVWFSSQDVAVKVYFGNEYDEETLAGYKKEVVNAVKYVNIFLSTIIRK